VTTETILNTNTPNTDPPMPGSEPFIHNIESAPAYWWLDGLWIVLPEAEDTGGRFSMMRVNAEGLAPRSTQTHLVRRILLHARR
jgi:hypothetical protein